MPIYAYKCSSCGYAEDVLQKISEPPLTQCPQCQGAFVKQLTAAGFQLRGSGYYATDFKNGPGARSAPAAGASESSGAAKADKSPAPAGGCGHGGCSACS